VSGADVEVTIRVRDPEAANANGDRPVLGRLDLIVGEVTGPLADPGVDTNPTTRVVRRFDPEDWTRDGEWLTMSTVLADVRSDRYLRLRGTNTVEMEPEPDPRGEDPWADLWFYTNPVFIEVR